MIERKVSIDSLSSFLRELSELFKDKNAVYRVSIKQYREARSISQNALQHSIYGEISKYLISHGRTEWDAEKVKLSLKSKFLGWEVTEITDVLTGEIIKKDMLRKTSKLDKGEAYHYTTQIIDWAADIGCQIRIPVTSEYYQLREEQEK